MLFFCNLARFNYVVIFIPSPRAHQSFSSHRYGVHPRIPCLIKTSNTIKIPITIKIWINVPQLVNVRPSTALVNLLIILSVKTSVFAKISTANRIIKNFHCILPTAPIIILIISSWVLPPARIGSESIGIFRYIRLCRTTFRYNKE